MVARDGRTALLDQAQHQADREHRNADEHAHEHQPDEHGDTDQAQQQARPRTTRLARRERVAEGGGIEAVRESDHRRGP